MRKQQAVAIGILGLNLSLATGRADERRFTYSYEPETLPQGAMEFEQWITLRTQRTRDGAVRKDNFNRWDIREELEYGVTDNYTLALYLNFTAESYRDVSVAPAEDVSDFEFKGIAFENRYRQEKWWAALTVLPQIYGANFGGDPDGHPNLELTGHERVNVRLIVSLSL